MVVASNLFGDILSDLGPACTGTIGIAPSGNINPERKFPSVFEPVHGSAPDIAGQGIANPIGQIWSGAMMLEHLGETEAAAAIVEAIEQVLAEQKLRTRDLGGPAEHRRLRQGGGRRARLSRSFGRHSTQLLVFPKTPLLDPAARHQQHQRDRHRDRDAAPCAEPAGDAERRGDPDGRGGGQPFHHPVFASRRITPAPMKLMPVITPWMMPWTTRLAASGFSAMPGN